jgi:2-polyprenyl-3-methyl-5-hydroxy-6-metoxy-1,4-benzoquinol methylase
MLKNREKVLKRACPICNHSKGRVLFHQQFIALEMMNHNQVTDYDVACCLNCNFVFADISSNSSCEENSSKYYKSTNKYVKPNATGSGISAWDATRFKAMTLDIDHLLCERKNLLIADIGCGAGGLMAELKNIGYTNVKGIDISEKCIKTITNRGFQGIIANISVDDFSINEKIVNTFDCIILSHVLEHVHNLEKAVENAVSCLKNDGIIYIEVPDANRYKKHFSIPFHYFDMEHINHFNSESMDNLIRKFCLSKIASQKKTVPLTSQFSIPAFFNAYKKDSTKNVMDPLYYNQSLAVSVQEYIELSNKKNTWPIIDGLADANSPVIVWGADWFASWLLANTRLAQCNIYFFIDNDANKHGGKLMGKDIFPVNTLNDFTKIPILICSAFHSDSILKEIKEKKISNTVLCTV